MNMIQLICLFHIYIKTTYRNKHTNPHNTNYIIQLWNKTPLTETFQIFFSVLKWIELISEYNITYSNDLMKV